MPKFAAIQMEPQLLKPKNNLQKVIRKMREAAGAGAHVAVFPECALTGYAITAQEAEESAEFIPGPSTERIEDACRDTGLITAIGLIERDKDGGIYNSAVLIGPEGFLGKYRKTHLPYLGVDRFLQQGDFLSGPFKTPQGRFGLLICYDLRFPEPSRVLALGGAQVILLSTAWPSAASLYPDHVAQTRAAENSLYLVAANRIGEERGTQYLGRSVITGPDGELLAEGSSDSEQIITAEIDPQISDQKKRVFTAGEYELDLFADRRADLYSPLVH
ncbi:MAG: carbon-nitrogen hydrolase family protein [Anaerolineales bacterium]|nr:carbon-nitrogen hydrolase family protein [Anaerolineales bacterium]